MTEEQQQVLGAAILETVRTSFSTEFSDKAESLLDVVSREWVGNYDVNDLNDVIDLLSNLHAISRSKFSGHGLIRVNWHEARSLLLNESMPALLNEYARFGEAWLEEMWPRLMPSELEPSDGSSEPPEARLLPASDRLVPLDHNSAPYREVKNGLAQLYEELRTSNDLDCDPDERDRVLASLKGAQNLWDAAQLKIIQIQVGIIITIEDAISLLTNAGKAVGKALVIDTIRAIVKHKSGIDI
jgi:hypothetical protein